MRKRLSPGQHGEWCHLEWSSGATASGRRSDEREQSHRRVRRLGVGGGIAVAVAITVSQLASIGGTEAASSIPVTPAGLRAFVHLDHRLTAAHRASEGLPAGPNSSPASSTSTTSPVTTTTPTTTPPVTTTPTTTPVTTTTPTTSTTLPQPTGTGLTSSSGGAPTSAALASIEADANWIASAQLPDGALANYPFNGTSAVIQPYMSNYGAIGLAEATVATGDTTYADDAWNWLSWYATNMDPTTGYVTDYNYQNGVETSTGSFDSTDAYAGTFLAAAWDTYSAQPSSTKLAALLPAIKLAVQAIESTQQPDGLTWATPSYHAKYLMDNAEVYGGLVGAENLARAAGDNTLAVEATQDATSCFDGIQALWNSATDSYDWARAGADSSTDTLTDWSVIYPDAFEQMWAIAWDATTSSHAATVLSQFGTNQPNWDVPTDTAPHLTNATVSTSEIGYWPFAATAYVAVGDPAADETAATSLQTALDAAGEAWPWNTGVAGQLVIALAETGPVAS